MKRTVFAPAKVNLILKVLSRRPDGYHNLLSLVDIISLYDVINIEEHDDDEVIVTDDAGVLPCGEGNTVYRAAVLIRNTFGIKKGLRIEVEKKIPIGAGLGGPSTDAATVMKALVDMWGLNVPKTRLMTLGSRIGADVPLFIHGKSCIMEGIGEIITPFELPRMWYVVVYPEAAISTKEVYGKLKIVLTNHENDIKLMGNFNGIGDVAGRLENDLEQIGTIMCPKIGMVKEKLAQAGALGSLMSGSGSSVFGIFGSEKEAGAAVGAVADQGRVFEVHSV